MNNVDFLFKKCNFFEREVWGVGYLMSLMSLMLFPYIPYIP